MDYSHVFAYQIWGLAHYIREKSLERDVHIQLELSFPKRQFWFEKEWAV